MLDIVSANPYRVLGVCSNSPKKELIANLSKINAFLKVGKPVQFPTDMQSLLPDIERNNEMVADANSKLALPADQFRYAQFWFVNATSFDDIALNNLIAGDIGKAMSIWEKREDASSLQNRIVCNLILDNISQAITCTETLYTSYKNDFVKAILGDNPPIDTKNVEYDFLDRLSDELGVNSILPYVSNVDCKQHISGKAVKPLVAGLMNAVSVAKQSKGNGPEARYKAGTKLMNDTKKPLTELAKLLNKTDLQYQMTADKVGLEILQCGIDYYNNTKTYDAPKNAMKLMAYALSIVVGQMARERCEENVSIVQKVVDNMLPEIVREEAETIEQELQKFYKLPELICHTVTLLNNVKPHLQSIKTKLGAADSRYLKLSTRVVKDAYYNVIQEVNAVQKEIDRFNHPQNSEDLKMAFKILDGYSYSTAFNFRSPLQGLIDKLENSLRNAWEATLIMDSFDLEDTYKNCYNENRSTLIDICKNQGIPTLTYEERRKEKERRIEEEKRKREQEEKRKREQEERKKEQEKRRKKKLRRGGIILAVFELIALILTLTVGFGFTVLMIIGGIVVFCIFMLPHML